MRLGSNSMVCRLRVRSLESKLLSALVGKGSGMKSASRETLRINGMSNMIAAGIVAPVLFGVASIWSPVEAATIEVTTTLDELADDGQCSLREAVISSNTDTASGVMAGECVAGSGPDTIVLDALTYNLTRGGGGEDAAVVGDLDILDSVVIQGAGQEETLIYGNDIDRVFHIRNVPEDITVTLTDLIVSHGTVSGSGGAILNRKTLVLNSVWVFKSTASDGGGIYSSGNLQLKSCLVSDNISDDDGAGIYIAPQSEAIIEDTEIAGQVAGGTGGGIFNDGTLTLERSTIELNQSVWGGGVHSLRILDMNETTVGFNTALRFGGGLANEGTASLTNSTISSNTATEFGGNIANMTDGDLVLLHATVADGVSVLGSAIDNDSIVTTTSSIFRGSCNGTALTSLGSNVESPGNTCNLTGFRDRKNIGDGDLDLYPLEDYGGPTWTNLIGGNSVAIDRARTPECTQTDQRGQLRPIDGNGDGRALCDSGAYEFVPGFFFDGFESGDTSRWFQTVPQ